MCSCSLIPTISQIYKIDDLQFVPYYQNAISGFLGDVRPIFKISRFFKTDLHEFSVPVFPPKQNLRISMFLRFVEIVFSKTIRYFLELLGGFWCLQNIKKLVLGLRDTSRNPEIMEIMSFRSFP